MSDSKVKQVCGVVMPISSIDGCAESHWSDVLDILTEAIEEAGFTANLVSNGDDSGIIHKRIIQNLYDNPIVVCDVSGKNPNVMFELGLRLAFDKPTVIVKDEKTAYAFDTSAIEHIEYPRDLRFSRIVEFKQKLAEKIKATHERATTDSNYTTFLKHFGEFKVAKIDKKEVSSQEYFLEEFRSLRSSLRRVEARLSSSSSDYDLRAQRPSRIREDINVCMEGWSDSKIADLLKQAEEHPDIRAVRVDDRGEGHKHLLAMTRPNVNAVELQATFEMGHSRRRMIKRSEEKP